MEKLLRVFTDAIEGIKFEDTQSILAAARAVGFTAEIDTPNDEFIGYILKFEDEIMFFMYGPDGAPCFVDEDVAESIWGPEGVITKAFEEKE